MEMAWKPLLMMMVSYRKSGAIIYGATHESGPSVQGEDFKGAGGAVSPFVATGMGGASGVSRDWGIGCIFMSMSEPADLQQHSGAATHTVPLRCNSRLAPTACSYFPVCWFSLP